MASGFSKDKDGFTVVGPGMLGKTLTRKLIPVVDKIRDLHTRFGGRVYNVSIIRTQWTGDARGKGTESITSITPIRPTPRVVDLGSLQEVTSLMGLEESGSVSVNHISGRFTEEILLGVDAGQRQPGLDENVFYEIEFPRTDGLPGVKRRFHIRAAPNYDPYGFHWSIVLEKADEDRALHGDSHDVGDLR